MTYPVVLRYPLARPLPVMSDTKSGRGCELVAGFAKGGLRGHKVNKHHNLRAKTAYEAVMRFGGSLMA